MQGVDKFACNSMQVSMNTSVCIYLTLITRCGGHGRSPFRFSVHEHHRAAGSPGQKGPNFSRAVTAPRWSCAPAAGTEKQTGSCVLCLLTFKRSCSATADFRDQKGLFHSSLDILCNATYQWLEFLSTAYPLRLRYLSSLLFLRSSKEH